MMELLHSYASSFVQSDQRLHLNQTKIEVIDLREWALCPLILKIKILILPTHF